MKYVKEILFHHSRVQLYNPPLVRVEILPDAVMTKKETKEVNDAIGILSEGKEILVLGIADESSQIDKTAREFSASKEGLGFTKAEAFVVKNLAQKLTVNFYLTINKPLKPCKAFTTEEDAIKWLREVK